MSDHIEKDAHRNELLSFQVGRQSYCIPVASVREIRGWTPITLMPQSPAYVRGVVSLRGVVIPIIDLNLRFGSPEEIATERSAIIVIESHDDPVGLLVDAVLGISSVSAKEIKSTPKVGALTLDDLIIGFVEIDGDMFGIVDIDAVMYPPPPSAPFSQALEQVT